MENLQNQNHNHQVYHNCLKETKPPAIVKYKSGNGASVSHEFALFS